MTTEGGGGARGIGAPTAPGSSTDVVRGGVAPEVGTFTQAGAVFQAGTGFQAGAGFEAGVARQNGFDDRHPVRTESSVNQSDDAGLRDVVLQGVADAVFVLYRDGTAKALTLPAQHMVGTTSTIFRQTDLLVLVHVEDRPAVQAAYRRWCAEGSDVVSCRVLGAVGWRRCILVGRDRRMEPLVDGVVVTLHDVTDQWRAEQLVRYHADWDATTGLMSERRFRAALAVLARSGPAAVVLLDVDGLGAVNEASGYLAGDRVLTDIGHRLAHVAPEGSSVGRIGGDVFAVTFRLSPGVAGHEPVSAETVAGRLVRVIAGTRIGVEAPLLTAKAGVAIGTGPVAGDRLLAQADLALRSAKAGIGITVVSFDEDLQQRADHERRLRAALRGAVLRDELTVEYQPVFALPDDRLVGFEALLRWEHPDLGRIGPDQFVNLAEQTGDIVGIGAWVLRQACHQLAVWSEQFPDIPVGMAVNMSARQLTDPLFVRSVADIVDSAGFSPARLCLEVTESQIIHDIGQATRALQALRATGVRVAIDDFGIGFSSLAYLRSFPADQIKVDRSFVGGLTRDPTDTVLVEAVVGLAARLGIDAVAEGVETVDQRAALVRLGCAFAQGFLWSPAVPAQAATDLLSAIEPGKTGWGRPWSPPATRRAGSFPPTAAVGKPANREASAEDDEVSSVMAYLAHEMRTPLHVIGSFTEVLRAEAVSQLSQTSGVDAIDRRHAEQALGAECVGTQALGAECVGTQAAQVAGTESVTWTAIDGIARQVTRLGRMVDSLRDARAIDEGSLLLRIAPFDVAQLVTKVVADLQGELGDHQVVVVSPPTVGVEGDADRIGQIVVNLLGNAAKFSPAGAAIDLTVVAHEGVVELSVADRGPGIPSDRVPDAFRRFACLDRRRRGTGLGLYLARGIARAHGGDLRYRRADGGGACFVLTVPRSTIHRIPAGASPTAAVPAGSPATGTVDPALAGGIPDHGFEHGRSSKDEAADLAGLGTSASGGVMVGGAATSGARVSPQGDPAAMVIRHDPDALHAMVVAQRSLLAAATVEQVVGAMIDLVIDLGGDIASGSTVDLVAGSDEVLPIDLSFGVDSPVLAVAQPLGVTRMRLETILPGLVVEAGEVARRLRRRSPRGVDPVTGFADRWAASRVVSAAGISDALVVLRVVTDDPAAVRNVARRLRISARSGRFARFDLDGSVDLVAVVGRHMVQQVRWALGASGGGATEHLPVRWVVEPVGPGGCVPAAGHGGGVSVMAVPGLGALARCQRQLVDSSVLSAEIRGRIDAEYR